jgi:uncharacterized SAM-binding protein YcdF (DUF218 family)
MFWLKKVIGALLMPLPLSLALIIAGISLLYFTRRDRLGRRLVAIGIAWLIICSNVGVSTWLAESLENRFPAIAELPAGSPLPAPLERCQIIVVLGGGHSPVSGWSANNQLSPSALARIVEGTRLARRLPGARLVVSGPAAPEGGPTHARLLADVAVALGVARERITEIDTARDTESEAIAVRSIAGAKPVALVTSAWHLPRATALCRRQGLDVLPCPADYAARTAGVQSMDFLLWNVGGLERSTKAIYEFLGLGWARLRGRT